MSSGPGGGRRRTPDKIVQRVARAVALHWGEPIVDSSAVSGWRDGIGLVAFVHGGRGEFARHKIVRFGVTVPESQQFTKQGSPDVPGEPIGHPFGCAIHATSGWHPMDGRNLADPSGFDADIDSHTRELADLYGTRDRIVAAWDRDHELSDMPSARAAVIVAAIHTKRGEFAAAKAALDRGRESAEKNASQLHLEMVAVAAAALAAAQ
jgi:hypothetical protein